MYLILIRQTCPTIKKGDLEYEDKVIDEKVFKNKKGVTLWVNSKIPSDKEKHTKIVNKEKTLIYYYTGMKWINENSGEVIYEKYVYEIIKV